MVRTFAYGGYMDITTDLKTTARTYYLVKIINGAVPQEVSGGLWDGLRYFCIELQGVMYWLTDDGLFTPPTVMQRRS